MSTTRPPIAFAIDGDILCPQCAYPHAADAAAIYDYEEHGPDGLTCDQCLAVIVPPDRLIIWPDTSIDSPRDGDNLGTLYVPAGNRYVRGDDGADDPADLPPEEIAVCLPVYAYVHGGVALSTGAFGCRWDSGCIGAIYVSPERVAEAYGADTPATRERAAECLRGEIAALSQWYGGDVWGYTFERGGEVVDSCGGFYGRETLVDELPPAARAIYDAGGPIEQF